MIVSAKAVVTVALTHRIRFDAGSLRMIEAREHTSPAALNFCKDMQCQHRAAAAPSTSAFSNYDKKAIMGIQTKKRIRDCPVGLGSARPPIGTAAGPFLPIAIRYD